MYSVLLSPSVEKDLRSLPKNLIPIILNKSEALSMNPIPYNSVKLHNANDLYRIRIGDYRVVYSVNHQIKEIIIQRIRHRRNVYRGL